MVRRTGRVALALAAIGIGSIAAAPRAHACSCTGFSDGEAVRAPAVVFAGELVQVRRPSGAVFSRAGAERFVFDVDVVYKGEASATQSVLTPRGGDGCGLDLSGPGPFLVFAGTEPVLDLEGEDGELYSTLCSGTRSLDVAPVAAAFGEGHPPIPGSSPVGPADGELPVALVVVAEAVLVVVVVALGSRLRRAREAHSWKSG